MDRRLQRICDRDEIAHLLHEYCRGLDLMDLDAVAAVFTEDCVVEYGSEEKMQSRGAKQLALALRRLWRWTRTSHHLSNVQVTFENDASARAISYVLAWHERPDGSTATIWGQYHDRVVRTDKGWRIAERRQLMNGNDAGFDVNIFRLERRKPVA